MVSDGFCWLRVTSDGFRWFAVLVVTSISQHTEHLTLYCTRGHSIFLFKVKQQEKIIVAWSPSRLKISDYFLYSIVLCQIKSFFQTKFIEKAVTKRQSQNTKQVGVLQNI